MGDRRAAQMPGARVPGFPPRGKPFSPHASFPRSSSSHAFSLSSTRGLVLAAMMAGLTAVLAYVRVPLPFSPVPVSGQTLGAMLAGSLLGARLGAISQLAYVLLGAVGLPVYAGGTGGLAVLLGPTGGYLVGFVLGAYVTGWMASATRAGMPRLLVAHLVGGVLVPYTVGVLQLSVVTGMSLAQAVAAGALPFLPGDALKAAVATAAARSLRNALGTAPAAAGYRAKAAGSEPKECAASAGSVDGAGPRGSTR